MISSIGGGSSSASNFSNMSVSLSIVSRKADRIAAGFCLMIQEKILLGMEVGCGFA